MAVARVRATVVCPRMPTDPPGDPCVHRFREAVVAGAVPFSVQGTENVWCLDGGRTIGWEMATQFDHDVPGSTLDRVFVQVGGGALAACVAAGLSMLGEVPRLHVVQTDSCAPLVRAWDVSAADGHRNPGQHWASWMWPWEHVGTSAADGILDDETYDWIPVLDAVVRSGGGPVVCTEQNVLDAHRLALATTSIDVSATGSAGLAGVLAARHDIGSHERIAVVFSGIRR
jgi:threonine synthase